MRQFIGYDEIIKILKDALGDEFNENRFAAEALAARIQEEIALYFRLDFLLKKVCEGEASKEETKEYMNISSHCGGLTSMIIRAIKDLKVSDKSKLQQVVKDLTKKVLVNVDDNKPENKDGTTPEDH